MTITQAIIHAASRDAYVMAKRSGLSQDECDDAFHTEFDRLFEFVGGVDGWLNLPRK